MGKLAQDGLGLLWSGVALTGGWTLSQLAAMMHRLAQNGDSRDRQVLDKTLRMYGFNPNLSDSDAQRLAQAIDTRSADLARQINEYVKDNNTTTEKARSALVPEWLKKTAERLNIKLTESEDKRKPSQSPAIGNEKKDPRTCEMSVLINKKIKNVINPEDPSTTVFKTANFEINITATAKKQGIQDNSAWVHIEREAPYPQRNIAVDLPTPGRATKIRNTSLDLFPDEPNKVQSESAGWVPVCAWGKNEIKGEPARYTLTAEMKSDGKVFTGVDKTNNVILNQNPTSPKYTPLNP